MNQTRFHQIISGDATGSWPVLMRTFLRVLSWFYGLVIASRGLAYRTGLRRRHRPPAPTVCVGNLTVGGTGKTPFVAQVCQRLIAMGQKPAVLSRGYRAATGEKSDESRMLAELLPEVPLIQNPDRVAGAREAVRQGAGVLVMDDGFSHLRLRRDLDILLFDATRPFGYGALLPRGLLREPIGNARRAGVAVITRCDAVSADQISRIEERLVSLGFSSDNVWHAEHAPAAFMALGGDSVALESLKDQQVATICGIANPDAFRATLEGLGARVVAQTVLPDHFEYHEGWISGDWPRVVKEALNSEAETIVVTQKDAVKLRGRLGRAELPVRELRVEMHLREGTEVLDRVLAGILPADS